MHLSFHLNACGCMDMQLIINNSKVTGVVFDNFWCLCSFMLKLVFSSLPFTFRIHGWVSEYIYFFIKNINALL